MAIVNDKEINTIDMKYDYILTMLELEQRTSISSPVKFKTYNTNADEPENVFVCWPREYYENKTMTLELLKILSPSRAKNYINFFGEEIVSTVLKSIKVSDLTSTRDVHVQNLEWMLRVNLGVMIGNKRKSIRYTVNRGSWYKEEEATGYTILTSCVYNIWESRFLRACLLLAFPYLAEFNFACYTLDMGESSEIYITCPTIYKGQAKEIQLYCPIKAFVENDFNIIRERQVSYHKDYYNPDKNWNKEVTKEQVLEWREEHVKIVASKTALRLRKFMRQRAYDQAHGIPYVYHPETSEAKEALYKADVNAPTVKIKPGQRFVIYGQFNGTVIKPIICREFEEGLKALVAVFKIFNAGQRELKDMFYREIISNNPEIFSVNYDTGTVTMTHSTPTSSFYITMEVMDIK